jgi:hypothetical protein
MVITCNDRKSRAFCWRMAQKREKARERNTHACVYHIQCITHAASAFYSPDPFMCVHKDSTRGKRVTWSITPLREKGMVSWAPSEGYRRTTNPTNSARSINQTRQWSKTLFYAYTTMYTVYISLSLLSIRYV